jgi:plastocyanin
MNEDLQMRMRFSNRRIVFAAAALSLAVACGTALVSHDQDAAAASAASAARSVITIHNYAFDPATVTVAAGTTVTWINRDADVHTIKSQNDPETFQSPALDSGGHFALTFHHAGTYHYICSVHPYMHGVIVVH